MLITRTPLRISLGGGGSDLPSFYERFGGLVISAAITKYIYVGINHTFTDDYFIKYSQLERADAIDDIEHPIVRESLRLVPVGPSLEIVSMADIPSGTGLGSSGAFTVGLLRALHAFRREHVAAETLAEEACHIEIDLLERSVGKQDQYIAAFGGLTCFEIDKDGHVHVEPLAISNEALHDLEEHLLMFFTGYARDADSVLMDQRGRSEQGDSDMLDNLLYVKNLGKEIQLTLECGDTRQFAALLNEHWLRKITRSAEMTNSSIDAWHQLGMQNGALGGKLVGAGGGGFLLFYADDQEALRKAMASEGLQEVRFAFDHDGTTVLARD